MSELDILSDALAKVLNPETVQRRTLACDPGALDVATLDELASFGLGGSAPAELSLDMLAEVMRSLGRSAALTPIVDSEILARWLAAGAGLETDPDETLTIAVCEPAENGVIDLGAVRFPNGRHAGHALLSFTSAGTNLAAIVPCSDLHLEPGTNLAGEARERSGVASLRFAELEAKPVSREFSPLP